MIPRSINGVVISNLFGAIGMICIILVPDSAGEMAHIIPTLGFYVRMIAACSSQSVAAVCVAFDGDARPFWLGSTLGRGSACRVLRRVQLHNALRILDPNFVLPLVPQCDQMEYGRYIRNTLLKNILKAAVVKDLTEGKDVGHIYVELLQAITEPAPAGQGNDRVWQFARTKPEPLGSETCQKKIINKISTGWTKKKIDEVMAQFTYGYLFPLLTKRNPRQQFGHCAETYLLIFLLLVSRSFFCRPLSRPLDYEQQGARRSRWGLSNQIPGAGNGTQRVLGVRNVLHGRGIRERDGARGSRLYIQVLR